MSETRVKCHEFDSGHRLWLSNTQVDIDVLKEQVILTAEEEKRFNAIKYTRRKREFLGVRNIIQQYYGTKERIRYTANGKPMLTYSNDCISISHSGDLESVITHPTLEVGVDLQEFTTKIMRLRSRFMSQEELACAGESEWKSLVYWSAKEALFKYYSNGDVHFKEQLYVHNFELADSGSLTADILKSDGEHNIQLRYEKLPGYILVYTLNG